MTPDPAVRCLEAMVQSLWPGRACPGELALGWLSHQRRTFAHADATGIRSVLPEAAGSIRLHGLMKFLTGRLVAHGVEDGVLGWQETLADAGLVQSAKGTRFAHLTVRHLIDQTHGLDDSLLQRVPLDERGHVHFEALTDALAATRQLHEPGRLYSQGHCGAWLAGALLEHVTQRSYSDLLREYFRDRGVVWQWEDRSNAVCPAGVSSHVCMSMSDALTLLGEPLEVSAEGCQSVRLPGWSGVAKGVRQGCMEFEAGWYGATSVRGNHVASLRWNAELATAVVCSGSVGGGEVPIDCAFQRALTDDSVEPHAVTAEHWNPSMYVGTYERAAAAIHVSAGSDGIPGVRVENRASSVDARLWHAQRGDVPAEHLFFILDQVSGVRRFIQFIQAQSDAAFSHIWDGCRVWRRVPDALSGIEASLAGLDVSAEEILGRC